MWAGAHRSCQLKFTPNFLCVVVQFKIQHRFVWMEMISYWTVNHQSENKRILIFLDDLWPAFNQLKRNFIHFDGLIKTKQNKTINDSVTFVHSMSIHSLLFFLNSKHWIKIKHSKNNDFAHDGGYFDADQFNHRCIWMSKNLERWFAIYKWGKRIKKQHYDSYFEN